MRITVAERGTVDLTPHLLGNLRSVHGDRVDAWLADLPGILGRVLDELEAAIAPGEPPLSYHLVFFARRADGTGIVVKCTVPNDEQPPELAAVRALSDAGIGPRLLWSDLRLGALAMERVIPGEMLPREMPSLEDDAANTILLATLARRMATEVDVGMWCDMLMPVGRHTRALDEVDEASALWSLHRDEILHARRLRDDMLADSHQPWMFLHGDLQHHNVLTDVRGGVKVIDPKGLIGPVGYEIGTLTWNPPYIQRHARLADIERQRIEIWSDVTGVPPETLRGWAYVANVVSACWALRGGAVPWRDAMTLATTLRDL
jgi:streptomycin 6-kinase